MMMDDTAGSIAFIWDSGATRQVWYVVLVVVSDEPIEKTNQHWHRMFTEILLSVGTASTFALDRT
jgi:hypothetical protein